MHRGLLALAVAGLLAACAQPPSGADPAGRFTGSLVVLWVGEGDGTSGDGKFVYVPNPRDPLAFERPPGSSFATIRPGLMYTDGGSIPKVFQLFRGLSPWGYAPAYMIHDWLFVARQCLNDGATDPAYTALEGMAFSETVEIIDEGIRALVASGKVQKDDVARGAVRFAVGTPVAERAWRLRGGCAARRLSDADKARVAAAFPDVPVRTLARTLDVPPAALRTRGAVPADVVAELSFR